MILKIKLHKDKTMMGMCTLVLFSVNHFTLSAQDVTTAI